MIKITIITCTYQAAHELPRTVESVLSQTHADVEHIILDGLSTDGTVEIARDYERHSAAADNGHEVIVVSEKDRGLYDPSPPSRISPMNPPTASPIALTVPLL